MEWLFYFLLLGAAAGLLAGVFGVGGGAIVVPLLLLAFDAMGAEALCLASEYRAHLALGTSFAAIIFTSIGSIWGHQQKHNIDWSLWRTLAPLLAVGVTLGSFIASRISTDFLLPFIGLFFTLVALQMALGLMPEARHGQVSAVGMRGAGFGIGLLSSFFGIGGGTLTVPWLRYNAVEMHRAVGTSAACGMPIALCGALAFASFGSLAGGQELGQAAGQGCTMRWGFIYWPALLGIVLASVPMAMLGARLAARLPSAVLSRAFAVMLFMIGCYILGSSLLRLLL